MKTVFLDNEPNWLKDFRESSFNLAKIIIPETEINPLISTSKTLYEDNNALEILDINEAISKNQEFFQKYFQDKAIFPHTERDFLINNAFFNSGLFIKVPKNTNITIPLNRGFPSTPVTSICNICSSSSATVSSTSERSNENPFPFFSSSTSEYSLDNS